MLIIFTGYYLLILIKIHFLDWSLETCGVPADLRTIPVGELANTLKHFYAEVRPKTVGEIYHRSSLINLRAAINRHIQDIQRAPPIDIVRDKEFKPANGVLDGLLKHRTLNGQSKPTKHKPVIEKDDLKKIVNFLSKANTSPIVLRLAVWYNLSIHFVSRGLEFHHQLKLDSFDFQKDDSGE